MAKEKGITDEEVGIIQGIVMAVSGGRIRAQFKEVRSHFQAIKNKEEK